MKTYEGPVNYADLSGWDIDEVKGYGPIGEYSWRKTGREGD
jgi:hypothetical protein